MDTLKREESEVKQKNEGKIYKESRWEINSNWNWLNPINEKMYLKITSNPDLEFE